MKFLSAAFGITILISMLVYFVLTFVFDLEPHVTEAAAGFPFIASGHIYERLEKRADHQQSHHSIYPPNEYIMRWWVLLVFAVALWFGLFSLTQVYLIVISGITDIDFDFPVLGFLELPLFVVGGFLIGQWVGSRCRRNGIFIIAIAVAINIIADRIGWFFVLPNHILKMVGLRHYKVSWYFVLILISGIVLYTVIGCIGLWRGYRNRETRYVSYLLSMLPDETKQQIIKTAYDEVRGTAQQGSPVQHAIKADGALC
jgi:hypothetical protein